MDGALLRAFPFLNQCLSWFFSPLFSFCTTQFFFQRFLLSVKVSLFQVTEMSEEESVAVSPMQAGVERDPDTLDLSNREMEKLARATPELILNTTTLILDTNKLTRLDNIHTYQCLEKVKSQINFPKTEFLPKQAFLINVTLLLKLHSPKTEVQSTNGIGLKGVFYQGVDIIDIL